MASTMMTFLALALLAGQQPWQELGGSGSDGGISATPAMSSGARVVIDVDGNPAVVWSEEVAGVYQVYFKRWNGSDWIGLGESATGGGLSASLTHATGASLALDSAGQPVVAWSAKPPGDPLGEIYVKRWNGTAWVEAGGSAGPGLVAATPADSVTPWLALDAAGRPVVAWREVSGSEYQIYLRRWSGAAWEELGGSASAGGLSSTSGISINPALDLDASGRPAVSWIDNDGGKFNVYLRQWNGSAWIALGGSASGGGVSASSANVLQHAMRVDAAGNPVVAWGDKSGGPTQILLRRWNGSTWTGLGGSADPGGISNSPQEGNIPSLALDAEGRPIVAWSENVAVYPAPANAEVYLRRWNGSAWVELSGSATGGGISATPATSPGGTSVQINPMGNVAVAWSEGIATGNYEIYFRRRTNAAPLLGAPTQFRLDGATPVAPGELLAGQTGFLARAASSDPENDSLRLQVEVRPLGTLFSDLPTAESSPAPSGAVLSIPIDGLTGRGYRWQARCVDDLGAMSAWDPFGSDPDRADFIFWNAAPSVTEARQRKGSSGEEIPTGARIIGGAGVRLEGRVADADGDRARMEFEVRPVGTSYTGAATHSSPLIDDGSIAAATAALDPGDWRWRHRIVDEYDAASEWSDFGENDPSVADFVVMPDGSIGRSGCGQSSGGPAALSALLLALLAARRS